MSGRDNPAVRDLTPLLRPRSIAMIGASSDPTRGNGRTLRYLLQGGFKGELFAINPNRSEVQGVRSWRSIGDLPQAVDAAIVAVPGAAVAAALCECAAAGTRAAIVFANGFAEAGAAGAQAQRELVATARDAGMILLGPNSLGAYDARARSFMTFSSMFEQGFPQGGRIGMVTQSGGWGSEARRLAADRGMSIVQWVSTGNEADLNAGEVLHAMALDPGIDVILLYLEGARDGAQLRAALEAARVNGKPVVAVKVGRTQAGQAAVATHTAALAGEDRVFAALCHRYGVHRADSLEELLDVAYAASHAIAHTRMPLGPETVIVTHSGGFGVHMTDQAVQLGLQLPEPPGKTRRFIEEAFHGASARNPVDLTGQTQNQLPEFGRVVELLLEGPRFAGAVIFVGMAGAAPALRERWHGVLEDAARRCPGKWLGVTILADPQMAKRYEEAGYAVFQDTSRMLRAYAALVAMRAASMMAPETDKDLHAVAWTGSPTEVDAKRILGTAGIGLLDEHVCADAEEAASAAEAFGIPVAVKVVSADIPHKTEAGGLALNVCGAAATRQAVTTIQQRVRAAFPQARISGFLVSPMAAAGTDCLVALHHDEDFGSVIVFGAGGVMTEWLGDVSMRLAPVTEAEARAMIQETRISKALQGWRGAPAADIDALVSAIVAISKLRVSDGTPLNFEVNPLRVLPVGDGVIALDALIAAGPSKRRDS